MENKNWLELLSEEKNAVAALVECNSYTGSFNLSLTEEEAKELVLSKKESLKRQGRLEFGESILPKLIYAFCDSSYIHQGNYLETLEGLQDIFFTYKNETMDGITDDELIAYMREKFEGECGGSLEYLEETILESFARKARSGELLLHRIRQEKGGF